jgi:hypothetical protein
MAERLANAQLAIVVSMLVFQFYSCLR